MSCETINVTIVDTETISVELGGSVDAATPIVFYQDPLIVSDPDTLTYSLLGGRSFRQNSLLVFLNGILQKRDLDYSENITSTGIVFLNPNEENSLEEDDEVLFYYSA